MCDKQHQPQVKGASRSEKERRERQKSALRENLARRKKAALDAKDRAQQESQQQ